MEKPVIERPTGPKPDDVVITDITVGDGDEAQANGMVKVHYVGVDFDSGQEFDSSWDRGMRVGGRRQLVIPPEAAYGPEGGGHPLSGRTLVFVIDLLAV